MRQVTLFILVVWGRVSLLLVSKTFTKLFSSITESTIWQEPHGTRLVWITMLAMSDRVGRVWGSIPGLAHRARVSVDETRAAIAKFLAPDPDSRTPDFEGRRIETIDGGWKLLNYSKYRGIRDEENIKASKRNYINKRRAKERGVENVELSRSLSSQAEAEAEAEAEASLSLSSKRSASQVNGQADLPTIEEVVAYGMTIGLAEWKARDWFYEMAGCGWRDYLHRPVWNWQQSIMRIKTKWEADGRPSGPPSRKLGFQEPSALEAELSELRFKVDCMKGKDEAVPQSILNRIKEINSALTRQ